MCCEHFTNIVSTEVQIEYLINICFALFHTVTQVEHENSIGFVENGIPGTAILLPVYNELMLIKADMEFFACLSLFFTEISNQKLSNKSHKNKLYLAQMLQIQHRTRDAEKICNPSSSYVTVSKRNISPANSSEFEKLLKAIEYYIDFIVYRLHHPLTSPREKLVQLVQEHKRDLYNGSAHSYLGLVLRSVFEFSDELQTGNELIFYHYLNNSLIENCDHNELCIAQTL